MKRYLLLAFEALFSVTQSRVMKKYVVPTSVLLISVAFGAVLQWKNPDPYVQIKRSIRLAPDKISLYREPDIQACKIEHLALAADTDVQDIDVLIVGHAYPALNKLKSYFEAFEKKFPLIIFTGDVLRIPSNRKWDSFKESMKDQAEKVLIAPGNHDIRLGDNAARDIFFQNFKNSYPIVFKSDDADFLIEDSSVRPFGLSSKSLSTIETLDGNRRLYIFAHYVLRPYPMIISNPKSYTSGQLPDTLSELAPVQDRFEEIYVFSGDTYAFDCINSGNITFLSNGLTNSKNDEIFAIKDGQPYRVRLP